MGVLVSARTIEIVAGEGTVGRVATYRGAPTARALRARLTRERCGGDRWARVQIRHASGASEECGVEDAVGVLRTLAEVSS